MALLWLSCPHCRVFFHIDDASAGRPVACRACGNSIRIPGTAPKPSIWYYTRDRKPLGPVTFDQLKESARGGEIAPHELVWREGMAQWTEARTLDGLYPTPPPVPPPGVEEPPLGEDADEPVLEVVEAEPEERPIAVDDERPLPLTPEPSESAPVRANEAASPTALGNWDTVANRAAVTEEPIEVDPEFQIKLSAQTDAPQWTDPPPTVDLVFPTEVAVEPAALPPEIELTPVDPKLELGEPDDSGPPTAYGVAGWSGASAAETVAVSASSASPPLPPYAVEGVHPLIIAPSVPAEAIAPAPMAIPVSPAEQRPRRETEEEKKERLGREYRQERRAWTSVRTGIGLVYLAQALWFAAIAGSTVIGTAVAVFTGESMSQSQESGAGSATMTVLLLVLALAVDTLSTVGFVFCLRVPETAGSRMLAIVTIALTGVALFGAFVAAFVPWLRFVVLGIGYARWLVFLFFLQTVATFFDSHSIMKSIERLLLLLTLTIGVGVALWFGMAYVSSVFAKSDSDTAAAVTMACASLCTSLPLVFLLGMCTMRYLHVMRDLTATIDQRLYRGEV